MAPSCGTTSVVTSSSNMRRCHTAPCVGSVLRREEDTRRLKSRPSLMDLVGCHSQGLGLLDAYVVVKLTKSKSTGGLGNDGVGLSERRELPYPEKSSNDGGHAEDPATKRAPNHQLFVAKTVFFFAGVSSSSLVPFIPAFMAHVGITGADLGGFICLLPIAAIIGAPAWGALARKVGYTRRVVGGACFAGACTVSLLALPEVQRSRFLIRVCITFGGGCLSALHLLTALVMAALKGTDEGFGAQKLWQSVGWGLGSLLCGVLVDNAGISAMFALHLASTAVYAILVQGLSEESPSHMESPKMPEEDTTPASPRPCTTLAHCWGPKVWWVASNIGVYAALATVVNVFLGTFYVEVLGASKTTVGVAQFLNTVSEVPVLFLSDVIVQRVGTRGAFTVAHFGFALRAALIASVPVGHAHANHFVVALSCLHGIMISVFQVASAAAVEQISPGDAMLHALNGALGSAFAPALGALFWSLVWGAVGPQKAFASGAVMAIVWSAVWNCCSLFAAVSPASTEPTRTKTD
eukprot:TRINITY_DN24714_c0_g1_i1.p1 TRINITY_DN24714_c0_g1~~TRINITY_DN24714_c0_g1_i1.p1  ORF type:complete len:522 (-),score=77.08 TRINITY_DN24714_c0_g1_i1:201-1766(-)